MQILSPVRDPKRLKRRKNDINIQGENGTEFERMTTYIYPNSPFQVFSALRDTERLKSKGKLHYGTIHKEL